MNLLLAFEVTQCVAYLLFGRFSKPENSQKIQVPFVQPETGSVRYPLGDSRANVGFTAAA